MTDTTPKRNQEAIQQAVLLGLLSQFYTFYVERPIKKSNVTEQILKIVSIDFGEELFEYNSFVKSRFKKDLENCNKTEVNRVKYLRLFNRNVHIFTNNFLFDLCIENGFFFKSRLSKLSKNSQRIEYFDAVYYHGKRIMNSSQINSIGRSLCKHFSSIISTNKQMLIHEADPDIPKIMNFSPNQHGQALKNQHISTKTEMK
ncbi:Uncharacterized protein QTN25_006595 [Entamoeba marina]